MLERQDIARGLRQLGVSSGDTLLVHSSLSSFGWVKGGAQTVVQALLDTLGPEGTLVVPTFSDYLKPDNSFWDREQTPSEMGAISEAARIWPGAVRSSHAGHPLAAVGYRAESLCAREYQTGFGSDSPFKALVDSNASVLLMGVDYSCCTLFHLFEVEAGVPYRELEWRKAVTVMNGQRCAAGGAWEHKRLAGAVNDFAPLGELLEASGLVRKHTIGQSGQRLFRCGDAYKLAMAALARDPLLLLREDTKRHWR